MEAVILIGLQGCGKSSFAKERFFHSHVRISLDLLKTRHREQLLLDACLATDQRFVVDNTNPTVAARLKYIDLPTKDAYSDFVRALVVPTPFHESRIS